MTSYWHRGCIDGKLGHQPRDRMRPGYMNGWYYGNRERLQAQTTQIKVAEILGLLGMRGHETVYSGELLNQILKHYTVERK